MKKSKTNKKNQTQRVPDAKIYQKEVINTINEALQVKSANFRIDKKIYDKD